MTIRDEIAIKKMTSDGISEEKIAEWMSMKVDDVRKAQNPIRTAGDFSREWNRMRYMLTGGKYGQI